MGVEEDVSSILHKNCAIKVWLLLASALESTKEGNLPEKQIIFRLVVRFSCFWVGGKLVLGTDKSLWMFTSGRSIAEGAMVADCCFELKI